jgi:hypothetical protein
MISPPGWVDLTSYIPRLCPMPSRHPRQRRVAHPPVTLSGGCRPQFSKRNPEPATSSRTVFAPPDADCLARDFGILRGIVPARYKSYS